MTRFAGILILCTLAASASWGADRIIGTVSPDGGAVLVKHFAVPAGTVVSGVNFVSNDLRTVFPKVALLRGPVARLSEAQSLLEVVGVRAEGSHHLRVRFAPLHVAAAMDLYVAVTLPPSSGVRRLRDGHGITATQLESPGDSYFASDPDAKLGPMDVDYSIDLILGQEQIAKANPLESEPEQSRPTTFLRVGSPRTSSRGTLITFGLERTAPTGLKVYDVAGREVRTLVYENLVAGIHVREWDGRDEQGYSVATGIFFIRLHAGQMVLTEKFVLAR